MRRICSGGWKPPCPLGGWKPPLPTYSSAALVFGSARPESIVILAPAQRDTQPALAKPRQPYCYDQPARLVQPCGFASRPSSDTQAVWAGNITQVDGQCLEPARLRQLAPGRQPVCEGSAVRERAALARQSRRLRIGGKQSVETPAKGPSQSRPRSRHCPR